jgi:alpha-amylase
MPLTRRYRYTDDISLAKNVAAFVILSDGIPIIYAGQEQHYSGAGDPANREATWLSGYDTTSELYQFIAKTNQIRNHAIWQNETYLSYNVSLSSPHHTPAP